MGGFLGALTLVLLVLKAFKVLNISWLWVFAPIWIPLAIMGVLFLFAGVIAVTQELKNRKSP